MEADSILHKDMISVAANPVEHTTLVIQSEPHTEFPRRHDSFAHIHSNIRLVLPTQSEFLMPQRRSVGIAFLVSHPLHKYQ